MDLREFSKANKERSESLKGFGHRLGSWSSSDWVTAIVGELGEAANVVKKLNRIRDGIRGNSKGESEGFLKTKLGNELADTFIYLDLFIQSLGLDSSEIVQKVFNDKSAKLGYEVLSAQTSRKPKTATKVKPKPDPVRCSRMLPTKKEARLFAKKLREVGGRNVLVADTKIGGLWRVSAVIGLSGFAGFIVWEAKRSSEKPLT